MAVSLELRAARHAALGDPIRLMLVDELAASDRAPAELRRRLGIASNLLSHHLDVLEGVGLFVRSRSSGDARRRYVHLLPEVYDAVASRPKVEPQRVLFVCTAHSPRSPMAAALWRDLTAAPAASAGTHPAGCTHPGAVAAARRAGVDIQDHRPRPLTALRSLPELVVTVCDRAHEELRAPEARLHWSVADPVCKNTRAAFDTAIRDLRDRIRSVFHGAVSTA